MGVPESEVPLAAMDGVLDHAAWVEIAEHGLPAALRHKAATQSLRAWVTSCEGGAAFGVALALLHEARRRRVHGPVRVIGSDCDAEALRLGRLGRLPRAIVARFPPAWRAAEHFEAIDATTVAARESLRRHLVFTRHQPDWDPPFAPVDLVLVPDRGPCGKGERERLVDLAWSALGEGAVLWLTTEGFPVDASRFDRLPGASRGFRRSGRPLTAPESDSLLAEGVANERMRLGQELHDTVGQHIAAASLLIHRLRRRAPPSESELLDELERAVAAARTDLRAISRGQLSLEVQRPLPEALRQMLDGLRRVLPAQITSSSEGDFGWVDAWGATQLLRIAQESVRNAAAGGAKQVDVSLRRNAQGLRLEVRDDGPGLRREGRSHEGLGLRIMRDRARMLGADLRFEVRDAGTSVVCDLHRAECGGSGSHIRA